VNSSLEVVVQPRGRVWPDRLVFLYPAFLLVVVFTFASQSDDSFITLRYARNILDGNGVVFNPGQHVQGFTSFLHLGLALVALSLSPSHALFLLKLSSLIFAGMAVTEGARLVEGFDLDRWLTRTGMVAIGGCWIVGYAAGNGLETSVEMWLIAFIARRLVVRGPMDQMWLVAAAGFLLVLTRPEAILIMVAAAVTGSLAFGSITTVRAYRWLVGPILGAIGSAALSLILFGSFLPNTFAAKDASFGPSVYHGIGYILVPFGPPWLAVVAMLTLGLVAGLGMWTALRREHRYLILVGMVLAQVVFILHSSGDWMHGGRFLAPVIIPTIALGVIGISTIDHFLGGMTRASRSRAVRWIASTALIATSLVPAVVTRDPVWKIHGLGNAQLLAAGGYRYSSLWVELPIKLDCLDAGATVASTEVGFLGFQRPDLRILDMRGLTDATIARTAPQRDKYNVGVVDKRWWQGDDPVGRALLAVHPNVIASIEPAPQHMVLFRQYRLLRKERIGNAEVAFYGRKGTPSPPCIP